MRLSPLDVFVGHWKSLRSAVDGKPDWFTRLIFLFLPAGIGYLAHLHNWLIQNAGAMLAAMSLMSGVLIGSFGQVTSLRIKLDERAGASGIDPHESARHALDETAAHLLMAAWLSFTLAIGLVAALAATERQTVSGAPVAILVALAAYDALLMYLIVPRLYMAYVAVNQVPEHLNGYDRTGARKLRALDGGKRAS